MTFSEELLVQPFYSGQLLSTLKFIQSMDFTPNPSTIVTSYANFPRPIYELVRDFDLAELQLTLTIGRWNYAEWGIPAHFSLAPTGVYAHAWMQDTRKWTRLMQTLSGLFCASTNLINDTNTAEPRLFPHPKAVRSVFHGNRDKFKARQAQMPREAVCTENLTPFLELLPCGRHAGLASLISPQHVLDNRFHSLNILIEQLCTDADCKEKQVRLTQTLSAVYNWARWHEGDLSWSLKTILGKEEMRGQCEIEGLERSSVTLVLPKEWDNEMLTREPMDPNIGVNWPKDAPYWNIRDSFPGIPVAIDRRVVGTTLVDGILSTVITNKSGKSLQLVYHELLAWYMSITLHDMQVLLNQNDVAVDDIIHKLLYAPAQDRKRPMELEMVVSVPARSQVTINIHFDKCLLRITEYPFDPDRGFDISPALFWVLDNPTSHIPSSTSPMLSTLTQLLVLPTPDFTMPYNAIMITSTLLGLFFGWLFNMMYHNVHLWQPGEEVIGRKRRLRARIVNGVKILANKAKGMCKRLWSGSPSGPVASHKSKQE